MTLSIISFTFLVINCIYSSANADKEELDQHMIKNRKAPKESSWNELLHLKDLQSRVSHSKVPEFMMELYSAVAAPAGGVQNKRLDGNIVRSYAGRSNGAFHFFNLTSFNPGEKIIRAEFRWFRREQPFLLGHHFYRVDLYEVLDGRVKPWRGNLIASRLLPLNTTGWEVFNVTNTANRWILNSGLNNGILVVSTLPSGQWFETQQTGREKKSENDAYLVIYSDDGRSEGPNMGSPLNLFKSKISNQTSGRARRSLQRSPPEPNQCQRLPLYVDFSKIGWSGWIISPRGYNAYHCAGSCPFPLGGSLRATNHAIVQSIVDALKLSNKIERPCCVPDVLHPISLLYFDDEENVVLKQYDDMVAASCGCH